MIFGYLDKRDFVEFGGAALRCGRWAIKHGSNEKQTKLVGYHLGKAYAYLFMCTKIGGVYIANTEKVNWKLVRPAYRGWIELFPKLATGWVMRKNFFEDILKSGDWHLTSGVIKDIRKMCKEIT